MRYFAWLFCFCSTLANASTVIAESVNELSSAATIIARGTIVKSQASLSPEGHRIYTYSELSVTKVLKGPKVRQLMVRQPGGVVGKIGQQVSGTAQFAPSEEVIVFLEAAEDEKNVFEVRGLSLGKVTLVEKAGRRLAVRTVSGLAFAQAAGKISPLPETELGTAEALEKQILAAVKKGAKR
jgi:hypothetical protein